MSLSRFYKSNDSFKATAVLDEDAKANNEPVWESIVKKEVIPPKPERRVAPRPPPPPPTPPIIEEVIEDNIDIEDKIDKIITNPTEASAPSIPESEIASKPEPVAESTIDIEMIREDAYAAGLQAGRQQAEEEFENSAQTFLSMCNELDSLRETILKNSAGEMRQLVMAISEKIIRHSVEHQDETIVATIKDALHLAVTSDAFEIQINPEDLEAVEASKETIINSVSGLENIILKPDSTVERGGCKLESDSCSVDATMTSQIQVIQNSVMADDTMPEL
ncbi:MAG: hypothetical protein KAR01_14490 [Desulfocapsa sp.]|nr:hypothetical protein [Desulfocapsa sp.]